MCNRQGSVSFDDVAVVRVGVAARDGIGECPGIGTAGAAGAVTRHDARCIACICTQQTRCREAGDRLCQAVVGRTQAGAGQRHLPSIGTDRDAVIA